jgi:ATP-dependent DNA helicase DinG
MSTARELLGPAGPLAKSLPGYESRSGQLEMADAVQRALGSGGILFCEAGTGTGKTLAYLVPAILSGRKVVVSTATRALQEQIVANDLPLIERALALEPRAAVMKGLANYLCLRRFEEFRQSAEAMRPGFTRSLGTLERWRGETESGDVSELAGIPEEDAIWGEVTSSSETRVGAACPHFADCFVTRMKREAESARLLIVNHHLFFADLALRGPHPARVIPDYDAVIFDEAHQLEEIATDFFGVRVSSARITRLLRDAGRALERAGAGSGLLAAVESGARELWAALERGLAAAEPRTTIERDAWAGGLASAWHRLDDALEAVASAADAATGRLGRPGTRGARELALGEALEVTSRRASDLRADLGAIVDGAPGRVTWFDATGARLTLSSSPIDTSQIFRERIFESIGSVVLTSATLTSGSRAGFGYLRRRLGVPDQELDVRELAVPSPFDFERSALLYTPDDLPPPADPGFLAAATTRIAELVAITGGGAFVLTTSIRSMHALHRGLAAALPGRRLLLQGQAPKRALISAFRAAGDALLVATMSFWEGVDVPGQALRLVVLEKIPFLVPTDPLVRARGQALELEGESPFSAYQLPAAALTLKQGFGRLIRTRSDRGIVALLDERVLSRGYGSRLLSALPPARRTTGLDEVRRFWTERGRSQNDDDSVS